MVTAILIVGMGMAGVVAIVRIATKHHEKMLHIQHGLRSGGADPMLLNEIQSLRAEVSALRDRVNDVALSVDDHKQLVARLGSSDSN